MNKTNSWFVGMAAALFLVPVSSAYAGCDFDYQLCEKSCQVKNLGDDAGKNGCITKCAGKKAACLAEKGADAAVEAGKEAWAGTKSFFKGLSQD